LDFDLQRNVLSLQVPDVCAKFYPNRLKIVTVRAQTDRQTRHDTGEYNLSRAMLQQWDR